MRVLQIGKYYPPRNGGMETALRDICECLGRDAEIRVLAANHLPGRRHERVGGVDVERLWTPLTIASQPISPGLWGAIRSWPADIVHLHEPNPLAMAALLASGHPGRLVVHYHSDIVRQRRLVKLYGPVLERGLARASAIVVGSREIVESSSILERWRSKCEVIPFGIDLEPYLAIRRDRGSGGRAKVLAVGRLSYYKGFQYLIEAAALADGFEVTIAGEGEMRPALERRIAERGVSGRVRLEGRVSDERLRELYAEADIFCLSSCERSEAFGLVQLEAMGAGLPVVSTDLPTGVRAINVDGETGSVVPPHDAGSLARALAALSRDGELRRRMGEAARQRAVARYDRRTMGARIRALYDCILRAPGVAPESLPAQDLRRLHGAIMRENAPAERREEVTT